MAYTVMPDSVKTGPTVISNSQGTLIHKILFSKYFNGLFF